MIGPMSFDFDAAVCAPSRMRPGPRRLAPGARQLTPNIAPQRGTAVHLRENLAVLQEARAAQVHDALASMGPAELEYRGPAAVRDRLLRWLAARSSR